MGRVGACSLSGCRTAAMRRLLGLLVCLPGACYSQDCPSDAPDYDRDTGQCYYHYGKGCDIVRTTNPDEANACCSNSDCERRTPHWLSVNFSQDYPVCSERGYCKKPNYRPTGPGCTIERYRVKCDLSEHYLDNCKVYPAPYSRVCEYASEAEPTKSTWAGGGLSYADKCAMLGGCHGQG